MQKLIEEVSDKIIVEKLMQKERQRKAGNQTQERSKFAGTGSASSGLAAEAVDRSPLRLIQEICKNSARALTAAGKDLDKVHKEGL